MTTLRTVRHVLRVLGQAVAAARPGRRLYLLLLIPLAPFLVVLALVIGALAPFAIYPFV